MPAHAPWRLVAAVTGLLLWSASAVRGDMLDMTGTEPWEACGGCHGLDGAGNRIKFPRIAGLDPDYIVKQLNDFRDGRRKNDGGQMQKMMVELEDADLARIAAWFAEQNPPWPQPTIEAGAGADRIHALAITGADGMAACLGCHNAAPPENLAAFAGPRIAGQRDFYLVKQLTDYREGRRENDGSSTMRKIAARLTDKEIAGLAVFLSQNPQLHEKAP